jgi:hypothetical protein
MQFQVCLFNRQKYIKTLFFATVAGGRIPIKLEKLPRNLYITAIDKVSSLIYQRL